MRLSATALTRQQLLRGLLISATVSCPTLLGATRLVSAALPPLNAPAPATAPVLFRADDRSFEFALPTGWVGATAPQEERANPSHIIAVSARDLASSATVRATVDGKTGSRGRDWGASLAALGPLDEVASRLVTDELIGDDDAKDAVVLEVEQVRVSRQLLSLSL